MTLTQQAIQKITSLSNSIKSLITTHNNDSTAHNDIRTNLNNKIDKSITSGLVKNDGTIDTNTYLTSHQDITGKENISNKVLGLSSSSTDTQYPSAKCVYDYVDDLVGDAIEYINR